MTIIQTPMKPKLWKVLTTHRVASGRSQGRKLREEIVAAMQACEPDTTLLVDFSTVRTLDFSAADEAVGGLVGRVLSGELGTRRFALVRLGESARDSIAAVLEIRKRQCLELRRDGRLHVLGPINPVHVDTLQFVLGRGEVAVTDVAKYFGPGLTMPAATNRLNTLADAGLVIRRPERGGPRGNRYAYASVVAQGTKPGAQSRRRAIAISRRKTLQGE